MGTTITGGSTTTGTITPALFLTDPGQDPVFVTTGAEGALGTIVGAAYGIAGAGSQDWTITNQGTIQATAGAGIALDAGGRVANQGTAARIEGATLGVSIAGTGSVTNDGTILGSGDTGILLGGAGGTVANGDDANTLASISGGVFGVRMLGAGAHLTNGGTITGGFYDGVKLAQGGTVTNGGTANAAAAITGNGSGLIVSAGAAVIRNDGTIRGLSGGGVVLAGGGSLGNGEGTGTLATIAGVYSAVEVRNGAGTVTNGGSISATGVFGVLLAGGGSVANLAGAGIYGRQIGVSIGGGAGSVTNAGTIFCDAIAGVQLAQGGTLANTGTAALIGGAAAGVRIYAGPADIANEGTIHAPGMGIADYGTAIAATLTNTGTIAAANIAAWFAGDATVTNGTAGSATARIANYDTAAAYPSFALDIDGHGMVTNYGTIAAATALSRVVRLGQGGTLLNLGSAALIEGGGRGVAAAGTARIVNQGQIRSVQGIELDQGGVVDNSGTIAGFNRGIGAYGGFTRVINSGLITSEQYGVRLNSVGVLRNGSPSGPDATISGLSIGVVLASFRARIVNDGTIRSDAGTGVLLTQGGTVTNGHVAHARALISGDTYGIATAPDAARPTTIVNAGTIYGDLTAIAVNGGLVANRGLIQGSEGIRATGGVSLTVLNERGGYIDSTDHAVEFADVDGNVFGMARQSGFAGSIQGGALGDTLLLMGPTPLKGVVGGLGSTFVGFETLRVADGGTWQLGDENELPNGGTIALDGVLEVAGRLEVASTLHVDNAGTAGSLNVAPSGVIEIGTGGVGQPGRLTVDSDGLLIASGRIAGRVTGGRMLDTRVVNDGTIRVPAGEALTIQGRATGSGIFVLGQESSLLIEDISNVRRFQFPTAGGNEHIAMPANRVLPHTFTGFADADQIDLSGFVADPALTVYAGHVLTLHEAGGDEVVQLRFAEGGRALSEFQVTDDLAGGTLITHV